jgi:hypothetical protein
VLRQELERMQPPLQTLAENILAEGSRIDLVTRDPLGAVVVVLIADWGRDLAGFTRVQAHVRWVRDRIPDWRQLAPDLAISPDVQGLLLCPDFQPETITAANASNSPIRLARFRDPQDYTGLVEPLPQPQEDEAALPRPPEAGEAPGELARAAEHWTGREPLPPPGEFRSGLTEQDLQLTLEERNEFS